MFRGIFRLIYYAFLVYIIYVIVRFFQNLNKRKKPSDHRASLSGMMVKDENCNTYLPKEDATREILDGKEYFLELTNKGKRQIKQYLTEDLEIKKPIKWDKKWRLVIYDIADDKKDKREILREKLERLGFIKLQESVYVFPFDCLNEMNLLKKMYFLDKNVQYLVVERIETEIDLLSKFYDQEILNKKMI